MSIQYWDLHTKDTSYKIYSTVLNLLPDNKKIKILDVGCGSGEFEKLLIESEFKNVTGIDISKKRLTLAKKKVPYYKYRIADVNKKIPFQNNTFDYVIALEVLEHIKSPYNFIKEMLRVSKKYMILTTPNAFWVELRLSPEEGSESVFTHLTESDFRNMLRKFNVKVEKFDYIFDGFGFLRKLLPRYLASKFIVKIRKT